MADEQQNKGAPSSIPSSDIIGIVGYIENKYIGAKTSRSTHEARWLRAYKNYRGVYDNTTQFRDTEKSKVFVKITKTKALAAYGQIVDILFANKKFPITVEPTPVPEGISEFMHAPMPGEEALQTAYGFDGDGKELLPGAREATPMEKLGGLKEEYPNATLLEGRGRLPNQPQISPAQETARRMEKVIHDQLLDNNAVNVLRHSIFESVLLGTGIVKGPLNYSKTIHKWITEGEQKTYQPYSKEVPKIEGVSCWDFFPDPAATSLNDCDYVIERHKFTRSQLRDLINMPHFDAEAIIECLEMGGNYNTEYYEDIIQTYDKQNYGEGVTNNRYEVLEYWGTLDNYLAEEINLEIPQNVTALEQLQINAWICNGKLIRAVLNPFTPERIPYHAIPYEINPYQLFGVGVPENMEDAQLLMNGHVRMAIDNLALAGNLVFDVDEASLVPGQNMDIFPGKIFRRQSGVTGTAINGLKFPNTAPENLQMYLQARQLADEETGIPSVMHGQTGVTGTGRTAAGLSMIMGGANLSIKTVMKNIDDYMLKPLGEAFFQWNMQFNTDNPEIIGDLEIKPRGVASVMQKEVRSQRLTTLLQTVANPMLAPFIKIPNLIRELAVSQDIDPDSLVNNMDDAQIFAEILRGLNATQEIGEQAQTPSGESQGMGGNGRIPTGTKEPDPSGVGNGTIGTGNVPQSGEGNFTGSTP
jgi:hypothetical protein|tara:strand:- start:2512 stop:4608 length:2097 start_codon:yes stop_codon:yes gene_type:complete